MTVESAKAQSHSQDEEVLQGKTQNSMSHPSFSEIFWDEELENSHSNSKGPCLSKF